MSDWKDLKAKGNAAYSSNKIEEALSAYSDALAITELRSEDRATLLCNRAQCHLKKKDWMAAVQDCTDCLVLSTKNIKALFRRASAFEELGKSDEALNDYKEVVRLSPGVVEARRAIRRLDPSAPEGQAQPGRRTVARKGGAGGRRKLTQEDMTMLTELQMQQQKLQGQVRQAEQQQKSADHVARTLASTRKAMDDLSAGTNTYRTVGRMFLRTPVEEVKEHLDGKLKEMESRAKVAASTIEYLNKKVEENGKQFQELVATFQKQ
jgi:tetratricopeptide (TPR) repeat protein